VGLPKQIDEFGDRPGGMADGEEGVRVDSDDMAKASIAAASPQNYVKTTVSTRALGA
jgi:hypothetical protein